MWEPILSLCITKLLIRISITGLGSVFIRWRITFNSLMFLGCNSFETCQILLGMTSGDITLSIWNFKYLHVTLEMIVSYRILTNISIEHFLNIATRDLFHSVRWSLRLNLNNTKRKMIPQYKSSCIISKCIYHKFVFSPEYAWSSKVRILCLSTNSETNRWSVSVYLSPSDQWLRNNCGNATLVFVKRASWLISL